MRILNTKSLILAGLAGLLSNAATATMLYQQTFDTDTSSIAQTVSTYGVTASGFNSAIVQSGKLRLSTPSGSQASLVFGTFLGDITVTFDTTTETDNGNLINTGLRVGDNNYIFHPGYVNGAFRIDGPGGHGNVDMGFSPTNSALNHVTVAIDADTGMTSIKIVDGVDASKIYQETFVDTNYIGGLSVIGLTSGSSGGPRFAIFDNFAVSSVPEPASWAVLLIGLGALGSIARRRRA